MQKIFCLFFTNMCFSNIKREINKFWHFQKDAQRNFMQNGLSDAPRSLIWSWFVPKHIFWKCTHFLEMHRRSRDTTTTLNFLSRPDPYPNARRDEITPCGETPHSDELVPPCLGLSHFVFGLPFFTAPNLLNSWLFHTAFFCSMLSCPMSACLLLWCVGSLS